MDELDATAARARVPERVLAVARVPADPADVLLFVVVVEPPRRRVAVNLLVGRRR